MNMLPSIFNYLNWVEALTKCLSSFLCTVIECHRQEIIKYKIIYRIVNLEKETHIHKMCL